MKRSAILWTVLSVLVSFGLALTPSSAIAAGDNCKIELGGHVGWRKCNMKFVDIRYFDSSREVVVVGSDLYIYHIVYSGVSGTWGDWSKLQNGWAYEYASGLYLDGHSGVVQPRLGAPSYLAVSGKDNVHYCNELTFVSNWGGWYPGSC